MGAKVIQVDKLDGTEISQVRGIQNGEVVIRMGAQHVLASGVLNENQILGSALGVGLESPKVEGSLKAYIVVEHIGYGFPGGNPTQILVKDAPEAQIASEKRAKLVDEVITKVQASTQSGIPEAQISSEKRAKMLDEIVGISPKNS